MIYSLYWPAFVFIIMASIAAAWSAFAATARTDYYGQSQSQSLCNDPDPGITLPRGKYFFGDPSRALSTSDFHDLCSHAMCSDQFLVESQAAILGDDAAACLIFNNADYRMIVALLPWSVCTKLWTTGHDMSDYTVEADTPIYVETDSNNENVRISFNMDTIVVNRIT